MVLGVLLGNSRLRYGLFHQDEIVETGALEWAALAAGGFEVLRSVLARFEPQEIVVGSVRDDRFEELRSVLPRGTAPLLLAGRDFPVPIPNRYERPAEAGIDRLLNALAARELWPGCSAVILDCGTALSVSVVSQEGEFLGGLIAAGVAAASAALGTFTPCLPRAEARPDRTFLKQSTAEALSAGLYWQFVGGVERILDGLRRELPPPVRTIATGGDAQLLLHAVDGIDHVDPDLTLRGLLLAARARG